MTYLKRVTNDSVALMSERLSLVEIGGNKIRKKKECKIYMKNNIMFAFWSNNSNTF